MNITVIIPSLNPDDKLIQVVEGLIKSNFESIIVIDDGSSDEYKEYFDKVSQYPECTVIKHAKNLGKGRALKNAFNYYLNNINGVGVITADADNQHQTKDIIKCANELCENPNSLILGVRDFDGEDVPTRSRIGNKMTSLVFKTACGLNISDTQTGLRAIPTKYLYSFMDLFGERFEYETNMLLEIKNLCIDFKEIKIETVYIEENKSSHFNPLLDSIKISRLLFKFLFSSLASFGIDLAIFAFMTGILVGIEQSRSIFIATVVARVVSSISNYMINKVAVFSSGSCVQKSLVRYYIVCILQMLLSFAGVYLLSTVMNIPSLLVKVVVDFALFVISFNIQREWVFSK